MKIATEPEDWNVACIVPVYKSRKDRNDVQIIGEVSISSVTEKL